MIAPARAVVLALTLGGLGCAPTVRVRVEPASATVLLPDGGTSGVPAMVEVRPFRRTVEVSAPGYRSLLVPLPWLRSLFQRRPEVEIRLVEEHGPAGTWSR